MNKKFLLQGVTRDNHLEAVRQILEIPHPDRVILCVAFMTESGLLSLGDVLARVAEQTTIVTGIRNDTTSAQGLKKSIQLGCLTYVVNTNSPKAMFHSKIYFSRNVHEARLLIGSANLTVSGLCSNIEASVFMTLDMGDAEDNDFIAKFEDKIDSMIAEYKDNIIQISDNSVIEEFLESGLVVDEENRRDLSMSDSLEKPVSDTIPRMKLKGPKTWDPSIASYLERHLGRPIDSPRKTTKELLLDCREEGLTLQVTADVLNNEGHRTRSDRRYTVHSVWHDSTLHFGEECPRSGSWARTCPHYRHIKTPFKKGEIFPHCPLCDNCKWGIVPAGQN